MEDAVRHLEARLDQIGDEREQAQTEQAFATLEDRMTSLLELNAELSAQNSAMAEAIHEFSTHTGTVVAFSAGADGGYDPQVSIPTADKPAPRSEFEARLQSLEAEGKPADEAMMFAIKENKGRYQKHLQTIGVMAREL